MLQRLPPSLWDQDPASVQGQLYAAVAAELTSWLEAWTVTRNCTLLQRAEGVDLDRLLTDYGIKRYNQRPDPFARQIARHVLFTPKETLFRLQDLAQLLTDYMQLVARSGRQQPHYWIAATHATVVSRTYWQLADSTGLVWYLTIAHEELVLSRSPAPGANSTPLPDGWTMAVPGAPAWETWGTAPAYAAARGDVITLSWFTVPDAGGGMQYVTLNRDGSFQLSPEGPPPGLGTTQRLELLDGDGQTWRVLAEPDEPSLLLFPLSPDTAPPSYWRLRDSTGTVWALFIADRVPAVSPIPPLWLDTTPGGTPLDWCVVQTVTGTVRYLTVTPSGTLALLLAEPGGSGTAQEPRLVDAAHHAWTLALEDNGRALRLDTLTPDLPTSTTWTLLDPQIVHQLLVLMDTLDHRWSLWIAHREIVLFDAVPTDVPDATPPGGPFAWWRLQALDGTRYAVRPDPDEGCLIVQDTTPAGRGTVEPTALGGVENALWHAGIAPDGSLGISDTPPVLWSDVETCLILNDPAGARWFWCYDDATGELVCSDVQEPEAIPWMAVGEVGALEGLTPHGAVRYALPATSGEALVSTGLQRDHPWALPMGAAPLINKDAEPYLLRVDDDDSLSFVPQPREDIPLSAPRIYVRDLYEALGHVQAGGSLTTYWVS